jgi:hypothetical protein
LKVGNGKVKKRVISATSVTKFTIDLPMASWIPFCQSMKGAPPALATSLLGIGSAIGSAQQLAAM